MQSIGLPVYVMLACLRNQIRDGAYPTYLPTYLKQPYLPHKGSSEGDDVGGQKAGRSLIIRGSEFKGWVGVLDVSGSEYYIQLKKPTRPPLKKLDEHPKPPLMRLLLAGCLLKNLGGE